MEENQRQPHQDGKDEEFYRKQKEENAIDKWNGKTQVKHGERILEAKAEKGA